MATVAEAAAILTRNADPHGDGFGIPADMNYSSFGGGYAENFFQYTVMSHFSGTETGANSGGQSARAPLLHDIAAAQQWRDRYRHAERRRGH
jgi:hypothetical protein